MTVWKFTCPIADEQSVQMPAGAEILHVASQFGYADSFDIWARVDPDEPRTGRKILVRGTGHPVGTEPHVGSLIVAGGALVWHVFDGGEVS